MAEHLVLDALEKRLGGNLVTRGVSLSVARSEIVALLGPSGSGKTTILRLVAGFETPDAGAIRLDGEDLTRVPPQRRNFGMVFQHYALFPHMTSEQNVAFGLEAPRHAAAADRRRRVAETLDGRGARGLRRPAGRHAALRRPAAARRAGPRPRAAAARSAPRRAALQSRPDAAREDAARAQAPDPRAPGSRRSSSRTSRRRPSIWATASRS